MKGNNWHAFNKYVHRADTEMHKPCSILGKQAKEVNPSTQAESYSSRVPVFAAHSLLPLEAAAAGMGQLTCT